MSEAPDIRRPSTSDEELIAAEYPAVASLLHDEQRADRAKAELMAGFKALADLGPAVSFFGSARTLPGTPLYQLAQETAQRFGEAGFAIITGGGPGIMEAANRGARDAGVASVGLNIELPFEQKPNAYADFPLNFHYFFTRKVMFVRYASAFVVFPGGFGTMDELFEALTLIQKGKAKHFPVVLMGTIYWQGLADWIKAEMLTAGNISSVDLELLLLTDDIDEAVEVVLRGARRQGMAA